MTKRRSVSAAEGGSTDEPGVNAIATPLAGAAGKVAMTGAVGGGSGAADPDNRTGLTLSRHVGSAPNGSAAHAGKSMSPLPA